MSPPAATLVGRVFDVAHALRIHNLLAPAYAGCGCIFMLHRVVTNPPHGGFDPNAELAITTDFLRAVLRRLRELEIDVVSLDEVARRLSAGDTGRFFVCFTSDDGYKDNLDLALPVFREFDMPFTVYVTTGMVAGEDYPWWFALERVIASNDTLVPELATAPGQVECATAVDKGRAFDTMRDAILAMGAESASEQVSDFCARHGVDVQSLRRELMLDLDGLARLAAAPGVSIGAHGVTHRPLAGLPGDALDDELDGGRRSLEQVLGEPVRHFCFPYGGRRECGPREFEAAAAHGFATATTTRKGNLFPAHARHMHCLPRVALKGRYQDLRYLDIYLSGFAGALYNRFSRVITH